MRNPDRCWAATILILATLGYIAVVPADVPAILFRWLCLAMAIFAACVILVSILTSVLDGGEG
jgi:hypothetical protein